MYFLSIITSLLLFTTTNGFIQKPNNLIATKLNFKMYIDELPIKDLLGDINNHKISKLVIDRTYQDITSIDNDLITKHMTHINPIMLPSIIDKTMENNIEVTFLKPDLITQLFNDFDFLFSNVIMPFFFISLFINIFRNIGRFNNMNMPSSTPNMFNPFQQKNNNQEFDAKKYNISLSSWVGSPEVFEECYEVISYMANNTEYKNIGAELPKGILLEGPPGTGKTLLAKAIASETNSTFFATSGSEFIELFVGMGAARIRELFENARTMKPSIIFIDEIDTIGRQRGAGVNMGNDEREQTLNQLLAEMDGFGDNDQVLVIAATNRKDVLDQALIRPGRFDRTIRVSLPDKTSRSQIIDYYLSKTKVTGDLNVKELAELTDGFSGAEIKNLINEASILAVRNKRQTVTSTDITNALEKLTVGLIRNIDTRSDAVKMRVSLHEIGHAFLTMKFSEYFELNKVSIKSTYNGAGGYTLFTEKNEIREGGLYTKDILFKRLVITMGGKAAESVFYGDNYVSLGAIQDLKQANELARKMIGVFGMGDNLKVFYNQNIDSQENPFLGRSLASGELYSDSTKKQMDIESINLVKLAYAQAIKIIEENKDIINKMATELSEKQILLNSDIEKLNF